MTEEQRQYLEGLLAADAGAAQPPVTPPQKFTFGGMEYESQAAAEAAIAAKMQEFHTRAEQAQAAIQNAKPASVAPPAPSSAPAIDQQKYFDLLTKDPVAAQDYLDRVRILGDPNSTISPAALMQQMMITAMQTQNRLADIELRGNRPEVPWHDPKALQLIEDARKHLQLPDNAFGRERAIDMLQARQQLPTRAAWEQYTYAQRQQAQQSQQPPQQQPMAPMSSWETVPPSARRPMPLPSIPTGGAANSMTEADVMQFMNDPNVSLEKKIQFRDVLAKAAAAS